MKLDIGGHFGGNNIIANMSRTPASVIHDSTVDAVTGLVWSQTFSDVYRIGITLSLDQRRVIVEKLVLKSALELALDEAFDEG